MKLPYAKFQERCGSGVSYLGQFSVFANIFACQFGQLLVWKMSEASLCQVPTKVWRRCLIFGSVFSISKYICMSIWKMEDV